MRRIQRYLQCGGIETKFPISRGDKSEADVGPWKRTEGEKKREKEKKNKRAIRESLSRNGFLKNGDPLDSIRRYSIGYLLSPPIPLLMETKLAPRATIFAYLGRVKRFPNRPSNRCNIALPLSFFLILCGYHWTGNRNNRRYPPLFFLFLFSRFFHNGHDEVQVSSRHRASYFFPVSYGVAKQWLKGADSNSSGADVNSPEKDKHVATRYVTRDREATATAIYNSCNQLAKRNDNLVTPRYSLLRPLEPCQGHASLSSFFFSLSHSFSSKEDGKINSLNEAGQNPSVFRLITRVRF